MKPMFLPVKRMLCVAACGLVVACSPSRNKLADAIHESENQLFSDSLHGLDARVAGQLLERYREFATLFPGDSMAPEYLFKRAELANGLGRPAEAEHMLDSLRQAYPGHARAATALFMEAFIFETALHHSQQAIEKYEQFLKEYPDHQLARSAKFSLLQLQQGVSTDDLVRMWEAQNDSAATPQ